MIVACNSREPGIDIQASSSINQEVVMSEEDISKDDNESQTDFELRERNEYNKNDYDKNLLLQFLHDEIPIINYQQEGRTVYFSDLRNDSPISYIPEDTLGSVFDYFYIVDMDGDKKPEFAFCPPGGRDLIKYNEEIGCFELWLSETYHHYPIGDGQIYVILPTQPMVYVYEKYDEYANLIDSKVFSIGEEYSKEKNESYMVYEIDSIPVSENEWYNETAYLFELIENAPKALQYQDLLSNVR